MNARKPNGEIVLRASDLWRTYHRGPETIHALAEMNLEIAQGEMVGLVGRSGSGKTTFLNLAGCLDTPSAGTIEIAGKDVTHLTERDLVSFRSRHVGFIFQLFFLIPTLTAVENVELPAIFRGLKGRAKAEEMLSRVGLEDSIHSLPRQMNGGDMQRVAIARALMNDPALLLADEPTGRLEHSARESIVDLFKELKADGLAIMIATHDPELASRCERVIELSDGRVVDRPNRGLKGGEQ
jgi:putative ABC transport system ATP-binding protein